MEVKIMPFDEARCPECKGDLLLDNEKEFSFCMHCGTKIVVQEAIKAVGVVNAHKVDTWMRMGKSAMEAKNFTEAYGYFTKVVETNPEDWRALFYKAYVAGCLSTFENPRIEELIYGIQTSNKLLANANLPKEELIASKNLFATAIFDVYNAFIALLENKIKDIKFSHNDKDLMRGIRGIYETAVDHHLMALDLINEYDDEVSKSTQIKLKQAIVKNCANVCHPIIYHKDREQNESYLFSYSAKEKEKFVSLYDTFIMEIRREIPEFGKNMYIDRLSPPPETAPKYEIVYGDMSEIINSANKMLAHHKILSGHIKKAMKAEEKAAKVRQQKEAQYVQEKYWKEHPEEYEAHIEEIRKERERLEERKRNLRNEINGKEAQFADLKKNNQTEISNLKEKRSKLGLFARKEKKEIDDKIVSLEAECDKFKRGIEQLRRELKSLDNNLN